MYYTINYPNINRVFYVNIINLLVNVSLIFFIEGKISFNYCVDSNYKYCIQEAGKVSVEFYNMNNVC